MYDKRRDCRRSVDADARSVRGMVAKGEDENGDNLMKAVMKLTLAVRYMQDKTLLLTSTFLV